MLLKWYFNEKKIEKDSDDFWHRKLTLKVTFWHFLTPPHCTNSQNSKISCGYFDFLAKIFVISYPLLKTQQRVLPYWPAFLSKVGTDCPYDSFTLDLTFWHFFMPTNGERPSSWWRVGILCMWLSGLILSSTFKDKKESF